MTRFYAGIGSRETPQPILAKMFEIAVFFANKGRCLRSGGAPGADTAFEQGCDSVKGRKQIFLPWPGFANRVGNARLDCEGFGVFDQVDQAALELAAQTHPNWPACRRGARALHARNGYQVLGPRLNEPVEAVICWTPEASGSGGTGQAIRLAKSRGIRIYDLADPATLEHIERAMNKTGEPT
jgi:hypothetical protein